MAFFSDILGFLLQFLQPLLEIITQLLGGFFPAS